MNHTNNYFPNMNRQTDTTLDKHAALDHSQLVGPVALSTLVMYTPPRYGSLTEPEPDICVPNGRKWIVDIIHETNDI
jgi:hypothetical protein